MIDCDLEVIIQGRSKEIIITAGGENIAPVPIEERVKSLLPSVANAILVGDERKYLTLFISMKVRRILYLHTK